MPNYDSIFCLQTSIFLEEPTAGEPRVFANAEGHDCRVESGDFRHSPSSNRT